VIGRRQLSQAFSSWNATWQAPFGSAACDAVPIRDRPHAPDPRVFGPFAFQGNNSTRTFEYPWAYFAGMTAPGMRALEIGGGLSGFQFVLGLEGCAVVNVDPGDDPDHAWQGDPEDHAKLNRAFGTEVELVVTTGDRYEDEPESFDRAYCLSVIEHMSDEVADATMRRAALLLRPGGYFVLTVDLLLDVAPFTDAESNDIGVNKDVERLITASGLDLVAGVREELFGFPEFDTHTIAEQRDDYYVGEFRLPVVAQAFVLRKPLRA